MKRQYFKKVSNPNRRIIEVTGDLFPIDVVISDTTSDKKVTFEVKASEQMKRENFLFEERDDEIYLTLIGSANKSGVVKTFIPQNNDFIVCSGTTTLFYRASKKELAVRVWKGGRSETKIVLGRVHKLHLDNSVKVSFFDRKNITIKL